MPYFQDHREPGVLLVVLTIKMAREVWEWKTLSMCQMLTRKIKRYYSIFVRVRNFSDTRKRIPVFQMMKQQACNLLCWWNVQFLVTLAKLKEVAVSLIVSVCQLVCMEQLSSHRTYFHEIWYMGHLWDTVKKCDRARQATDDNIIWCMCFACLITKATHMRACAHTHTHTHS